MHKIKGRAFYCSYLACRQYWIDAQSRNSAIIVSAISHLRRNKRFHPRFCQRFGPMAPLSPQPQDVCPQDLFLLAAGASASLAPRGCGAFPRGAEPVWGCPHHHHGSGWSSAWEGFSVPSPFYPGSSLSLKEAGTQPALVQQAASLGTFPVVTAPTLQGLPEPNHSRKRSPPPSDIDNRGSSRRHRTQESI